MKAAVVGAVVAAGLVIAAVIGVSSGLLNLELGDPGPARILVIASAPDESGANLAPVAFVIDPATGQVTLLDTLESATVSGTSAATAREALPFGGGEAVAAALKAQTGGRELDWIVVRPQAWADLIDEAGGVTLDIPNGVSAYSDGRLTLLESGTRKLDGQQAVAAASAVGFMGSPDEQRAVLRQLTAAVSAITGSSGSALRELVRSGEAQSSLLEREVPVLEAVQ